MKSDRIIKIMALSLLLISLVVVLVNFNTEVLSQFFTGVLTNLPVLLLILLVPLIMIPIREKGYLESVSLIMEKVKNTPEKLFLSITSFTALLAPVFNLASIRVVNSPIENIYLPKQILSSSYFIGFTTSMLWSPYLGSLAIVIFYVGIPMSSYLTIGLIYAGVQLLIILVIMQFMHKTTKTKKNNLRIERSHFNNIFKFFLIIFSLIIILITVEYLTGVSMVVLVSVIAIIFPLMWMVSIKKFFEFKREFRIYLMNIPNMSNEIALFLSSGVFGSVIQRTQISEWINLIFILVFDYSVIFLVILIYLIIVVMGLIGVHPIIVTPIIAQQIDYISLGINPIIIVITLITGWAISAILSPFDNLNLIVRKIVNESTLTIGFNWSRIIVCNLLVVSIFFILLLTYFH